MSEDAEVEAIVQRARRDAEQFLRQEWRGRQRECLFGAGGMFLIGALLVACVGPVFSLDLVTMATCTAATTTGAMILCAWRWRCPRCERIPWTGATLVAHRVFSPRGCPHCALQLVEPVADALTGQE